MKNQELVLTVMPSNRTSTVAKEVGVYVKAFDTPKEQLSEVFKHSNEITESTDITIYADYNDCYLVHKPSVDVPVPNDLYKLYQSAQVVQKKVSSHMEKIDICETYPAIIVESEKASNICSIFINCADTDALADGDGVYVNSYKLRLNAYKKHLADYHMKMMIEQLYQQTDTMDITTAVEDDVMIYTVIRSASENYTTLGELIDFGEKLNGLLMDGLSANQRDALSLNVIVSA